MRWWARPRVVVVGAGFGGMAVVQGLEGAAVDIDRCNHHLFQPSLHQVATADRSPVDIARPIPGILSGQRNARLAMGNVTGVDTTRRRVLLRDFLVSLRNRLLVMTQWLWSYLSYERGSRLITGQAFEDGG